MNRNQHFHTRCLAFATLPHTHQYRVTLVDYCLCCKTRKNNYSESCLLIYLLLNDCCFMTLSIKNNNNNDINILTLSFFVVVVVEMCGRESCYGLVKIHFII